MNEQEQKKFREKYESLMDAKDKMTYILDKMHKLEEDMYVKEYLKLQEEYKKISDSEGYEIPYISEEQLLEKAIRETEIEETNNIYVCMSAYNGKYGLDESNVKSRYRVLDAPVDYDSKEADYKQYYNIELSKSDEGYEINIPIAMCKEFENNNLVLYPPDIEFANKYYDYVKRTYFTTIYESNEEKAIEKVMTKRIKNK
ncbi:MAG: hypothetical protein IJF92_01025 [Bacilli bacterium]|nr:hypothetical protein [Bacilli bacterium]